MSDAQRKRNVIELLELLASEDEQLAYEANVPHVDITLELVAMWFDDLCRGDGPPRDGVFAPDEQAALADFHRFYDGRRRRLPASEGTVRTWLANPAWREIMKEAHTTLERIKV